MGLSPQLVIIAPEVEPGLPACYTRWGLSLPVLDACETPHCPHICPLLGYGRGLGDKPQDFKAVTCFWRSGDLEPGQGYWTYPSPQEESGAPWLSVLSIPVVF